LGNCSRKPGEGEGNLFEPILVFHSNYFHKGGGVLGFGNSN
jgi:hypothetical protein